MRFSILHTLILSSKRFNRTRILQINYYPPNLCSQNSISVNISHFQNNGKIKLLIICAKFHKKFKNFINNGGRAHIISIHFIDNYYRAKT